MRDDMPVLFGENAPDWMCISLEKFKGYHSTTQYREPDPAIVLERQTRNAAAHAASRARKEVQRAERERIRVEEKAADAAAREEMSRQRQAERVLAMEAELRIILRELIRSRIRTARAIAKARRMMTAST